MKQRVNIEQSLPHAWKAMYALSVSLGKTSLTPVQQHLIKIRVSQINSCAFCINMHTKEALAIGESQQRIFVLSAWKETDLFTPEEKAILALTEEVTLIHQHGISDETYQQAEGFFNAETIGNIIMATIAMNGWNRIAVSTHLQVN
jgi:AhpD family alkylhydroperoxidase